MVANVAVQDKIFSGNRTEFTIVSRAVSQVKGQINCLFFANSAKLSGDFLTGTSVSAGSGASLEHLVRELTSQFARQSEQFTVLANSMADMQTASRTHQRYFPSRTTEGMHSHEARASDISFWTRVFWLECCAVSRPLPFPQRAT